MNGRVLNTLRSAVIHYCFYGCKSLVLYYHPDSKLKAEWILSCCCVTPACSHHQLFAALYNNFLRAINQMSVFEMYMVTREPTMGTNMITSHLFHTARLPCL